MGSGGTELPVQIGVLDSQKKDKVLEKGSSHYKDCNIEPVQYIAANSLDFFQGNVVKYVTRHKKAGKSADIRKAIHYLEMILKYDYNEELKNP